MHHTQNVSGQPWKVLAASSRPGSLKLSSGRVLLEVVCMSADDCAAAEEGGADRIELVSGIELGGLTPSLGTLLAAKRACRLPIMVMIRPRSGGFCYSKGEFEAMKEDARSFLEAGAGGLVAGILNGDGSVDVPRCAELLRHASDGVEWVFHRAFDVCPEPFDALESLIGLGFERILTSGQRPTALEGIDLIRDLSTKAKGRAQILPGSGIGPHNVREIVARSGVSQVHFTAWDEIADGSTASSRICFNGRQPMETGFRATSVHMVRAVHSGLL